MSTRIKVRLGTVSEGTMRLQDLIPAFASVLEEEGGDPTALNLAIYKLDSRAYVNGEVGPYDNDDHDYWHSEDARWDLDELLDALNELAPPYCYFGAHPGDGADYGFWVSEGALQEGLYSGEIVRSEDMPYRLDVSDRGNMTLYDQNGDEVWSVV